MYRLKHIYPEAVLLIIYQSIINTHFTYGLLVWGSKINQSPFAFTSKEGTKNC